MAGDDYARWATAAELRGAGWLAPGGWPLGPLAGGASPVFIPRGGPQTQNVLALAPPGAGKSRGILVPALLSETRHPKAARRSLIVVDPEGELYRLTGRQFEDTHRVLVWNPGDPAMSNCTFDPLRYVLPPEDLGFVSSCEAAAEVWFAATHDLGGGARKGGDPYWDKQGISVLKAVLLKCALSMTAFTLPRVMDYLMGLAPEALQKELADTAHETVRYRAMILADLMRNEKAVGGVFTDTRERFMLLANPPVRAALGGSGKRPFDVRAFIDEPTILYLQVSTRMAHAQPLLSVFLATVLQALPALSASGQRLRRDVRVVIDELANIGRIHNLESTLATIRKYGVGFLMATQTRARLMDRYGPEVADAILGCCGTVLVLGGVSYNDAVWAAGQLGMEEVRKTDVSYNPSLTRGPRLSGLVPSLSVSLPLPSLGRHASTHRVREPLKTADALRAMVGTILVLPTRLRPFETRMALFTG